jgi:F0F1-type ATP synthase delta subunit
MNLLNEIDIARPYAEGLLCASVYYGRPLKDRYSVYSFARVLKADYVFGRRALSIKAVFENPFISNSKKMKLFKEGFTYMREIYASDYFAEFFWGRFLTIWYGVCFLVRRRFRRWFASQKSRYGYYLHAGGYPKFYKPLFRFGTVFRLVSLLLKNKRLSFAGLLLILEAYQEFSQERELRGVVCVTFSTALDREYKRIFTHDLIRMLDLKSILLVLKNETGLGWGILAFVSVGGCVEIDTTLRRTKSLFDQQGVRDRTNLEAFMERFG